MLTTSNSTDHVSSTTIPTACTSHVSHDSSLKNNPVINRVRDLIETMNKLPGISVDAKQDDMMKHRNNLLACLNELEINGTWSLQQSDYTIRPRAVGLQAIFEYALLNALESGDVVRADIIFTTINPVTPLCHANALCTSSLMTGSVANHAGSYDTVIERAKTVPKLLNHPLVHICSIYSKERENPQDQAIYDEVCLSHPDKNKFYSLCSGKILPESLSGANYFVTLKGNNVSLFGIRITQANIETDNCVIFTKDEQQKLKDLSDNYMDVILKQQPEDENLSKFVRLLHQNYA